MSSPTSPAITSQSNQVSQAGPQPAQVPTTNKEELLKLHEDIILGIAKRDIPFGYLILDTATNTIVPKSSVSSQRLSWRSSYLTKSNIKEYLAELLFKHFNTKEFIETVGTSNPAEYSKDPLRDAAYRKIQELFDSKRLIVVNTDEYYSGKYTLTQKEVLVTVKDEQDAQNISNLQENYNNLNKKLAELVDFVSNLNLSEQQTEELEKFML